MRRMTPDEWNAYLIAEKMAGRNGSYAAPFKDTDGKTFHCLYPVRTKQKVPTAVEKAGRLGFDAYPPNLWPKRRTKRDVEAHAYPVEEIRAMNPFRFDVLVKWIMRVGKMRLNRLDGTWAEAIVEYAITCPQILEVIHVCEEREWHGGFAESLRKAAGKLLALGSVRNVRGKARTKLKKAKRKDAHHRSTTGKRRPVSAHRKPHRSRRLGAGTARCR